ncbi:MULTISPECIES: hypothetical protein [Bacillota]|uniref:Antitoxin VbhA domain-containing protein n=1 Tax=Virgibacillus dokdonensis TaxID=302167 RepID=A0ABU7VKA2_9BACI|nr:MULTISPECIES: hypothetical protein [Bacillota]NBJ68932.1 hypothetical protein [Roseburia sp. 1XD42-34]NWO14618.1 hypothetical protein [Virgibacillus sp.]RKI79837.1 hypothetical protein D7V87_05510 [Clostridium sp. 1xD42-85]
MKESSIKKGMLYAKKTLEMENLKVSEEQTNLVRESLNGEISHDQFIKKALELANESITQSK